VRQLSDALRTRGVVYCQWKGHRQPDRWAGGGGDIDLLIDRRSLGAFTDVMGSLGFKLALPRPGEWIPGLVSYFGFDPQLERLVHVHAHYQLILGAPATTTHRVPIEAPVLATTVQRTVFRAPAPEFELLLAMLRTLHRQRLRDALRPGHARRLARAREELQQLRVAVDPVRLRETLREHLPFLDEALLHRCLRSLDLGTSEWTRVLVRWQLRRRLRAHARRPSVWTVLGRVGRAFLTLRGRLGRASPRKRFLRGGVVIALVGGDGAGKSSSVRALSGWLSKDFVVLTAHLGRPPRSLPTLAVGAALKASRWFTRSDREPRPSHIELLRTVCTARDRYRLYAKARRCAAAGGVALCERYPVPQNRSLVGPSIPTLLEGTRPGRLATALLQKEAWYYRQILPPDVLIVLRVDPEIAVRRKTDEPADYVRTRARIVWNTDWAGTETHVVNADRPMADVLAELKTLIWAEL